MCEQGACVVSRWVTRTAPSGRFDINHRVDIMKAMNETPTIPAETKEAILKKGPGYDEALNWILEHGEDGITESYEGGIDELIRLSNDPSGAVFRRATRILIILAIYNQQDWLHYRMKFHALAGIGKWAQENGIAFLPKGVTP